MLKQKLRDRWLDADQMTCLLTHQTINLVTPKAVFPGTSITLLTISIYHLAYRHTVYIACGFSSRNIK